jgi:predicted Zn-dependent peptidase
MSEFVRRYSEALGETYYETVHPSGLRITVCPKDLSTYYATVGVRYGSADMPAEGRCPLGVAHFLEHKLFEYPDGDTADRRFSLLGADSNAYTSYDRTVYLASCTQNFQDVLAELLHMTSSLSVTEESVARERSIIAEEIRMNADSPWERCYAEMLRALYHRHRVKEEICGSEASIEEITPELLEEYFNAYYTPENMVLAVSGRVTPEDVLAVVNMCMPTEPERRPIPVPVSFDEPREVAEGRIEIEMQVAKPLFCIGIKDPDVPTESHALLRHDLGMTVLCEMLFSRSGDFYSELFESGRITPGMSYGSSAGQGFGWYALTGEADDPDGIFESFCAYVDSLHRNGLSREDFEISRRILYADFVTGFDSTEEIAGTLCGYALDGLDPFEFLAVTQEMTFEDVEALFESSFRSEHFAMSVVVPDAAQNQEIR